MAAQGLNQRWSSICTNSSKKSVTKEWHGKVVRYYRDFHRAMVVSLEEGYEGCEEDVWLEQVVRIEQLTDSVSALAGYYKATADDVQ